MMPNDPSSHLILKVIRARCGQLPVVLGAAPAAELCSVSFADVLDEAKDEGYQRPIDWHHSKEFRAYIERPGATTIPLTFNLRGREGEGWTLSGANQGGVSTLKVRRPRPGLSPVLAQVDCQHRLGMMADSDILLTFQCFLGLSPQEEMAIFSVINGKAKGLSSSLLDYHTTKLTPDLAAVQVDLYIAKMLNDDRTSVWHGKVKLGGTATQGSTRRISLRGLQTATKLLLQRCPFGPESRLLPRDQYQIVSNFWTAVVNTWPTAWAHPRTHLLVKGVGVTALSMLAGDIITAALSRQQPTTAVTFATYLSQLADLDWSTTGQFKAFGGRQGASEAHQLLAARLFAPGLALVRAAT
jgi:DNA sulfur modification protein DndB